MIIIGLVGAAIGFLLAAVMAASKNQSPEALGPGLLIWFPEHGRGKYFLFGEGINGAIVMVPPLKASDHRKHPAWIVGEIMELVELHKIEPDRIAGHGPNVPELIKHIRETIAFPRMMGKIYP